MIIIPFHQSDRNSSLFGLLGSRFLYKKPGKERAHKIPDDEVSGKKKEVIKERTEMRKLMQADVKRYNDRYGRRYSRDQEAAHYEMLVLDFRKLSRTVNQINSIIAKITDRVGVDNLDSDPQYRQLSDMKRYIEEYKKLVAQGPELLQEARRGRLRRRHETTTEALDRRKVWMKKPLYREIDGMFESLDLPKEFENVWMSPDGLQNPNQREMKELFLAIMAEKTNNFQDSFVLGEAFQNDPEANIRNFPYIYDQFLKYEGAKITGETVSLQAIAEAESKAAESVRNLGPRTAEQIVAANPDAGLKPVPPIPTIPATPKWEERLSALIGNVNYLRERADKEPDLAQTAGWAASADELQAYVTHARAHLQLSRLKDREKLVQSRFTRQYLSNPIRRKNVITWCMRKFVKAMEMTDNLYGTAVDRDRLHPTVRRMVIASIYETGVARYKKSADGEVTYEENISKENQSMFSALMLSDYFNFKEVGEKMDKNHVAILKAAWLSSKVGLIIEKIEETKGVLDAWIKVKKSADPSDPDYIADDKKREVFIERTMAVYPKPLADRFRNYDVDRLQTTLDQTNANQARLVEFTQRTREAIQDPYSDKARQFIADIEANKYAERVAKTVNDLGEMGIIDRVELEGYMRSMHDLDINFKTAELQEGNMQMFFEGLGMHIEGLYPKYLSIIRKNPKLKTDYWDHLLLGNDAEFNSLVRMFQIILSDDDEGGKADFIAGLQSIRQKYKGKKTMTEVMGSAEEGSEDMVVLNTLQMLRLHLGKRAETAAFSDRQALEIDAKLRGVHIGDKVSEYVGGVWDMLTGPGQSTANRVAGFVLMYGMYKAARKAMKGEGKTGKLLRAVFVAGAVEIAAKEITGRGILDRMGLDSIAGAMEGTYEEVLRQDGEEHMEDKNITPEAHSAALIELNDVPFHQVMEWYESSDPNGMPTPPGSKDKFPRQIDLGRIAPKVTWVKKDKEREARHVVYETVKHFFGYVGEKANKRDAVHGKEELKERWIRMIPGNKGYDPKYKPQYSDYDHREWIEATGAKQKDITWQMVMRAEIDPSRVDLTRNKTHVGVLTATAKEWYEEIAQWSKEHVYNPGSGYAEVIFDGLGEQAASVKQFLSEVYKETGRKIYFGKEKIILWYGEHQYEIRRVAENHWNLLVTGVGLPFKVVLAVDNWAIPWTLTNLKRIEESLRDEQIEADNSDGDLHPGYIVEDPMHMGSDNLKLNRRFKYFGPYQESFLDAMTTIQTDAAGNIIYSPRYPGASVPMRAPKPHGDWFQEDPGTHVGYYISEVTYAEAGIDMSNPLYSGSISAVNAKLIEASRGKARQRFRDAGMSWQEIDKYMYSIHSVMFTKGQKMYVFWRMPLKDSAELYLKESGHWADYMDPKKDEGFRVDPSRTKWENLKHAFALQMGPTRTLFASVGGYAAQIPKFMFWNYEVIGGIVKAIGREMGAKKDFEDAVDGMMPGEKKQQIIDEFFTSAKSKHMALSEFYSNETNAKLYNFALECAHHTKQPLFLGFFEGKDGYEGHFYMEGGNEDYIRMWKYYRQTWVHEHNGKLDADIEAALTAKFPEPPMPY